MKIAINLTFLYNNFATGLGKHSQGLLEGLAKENLLQDFTIYINPSFESTLIKHFPEAKYIIVNSHKINRYIDSYIRNYKVIRLIEKCSFDLILNPYHESSLFFSKGIPSVTVVHDLTFKRVNIISSKIGFILAEIGHFRIVKNSSHLITPSTFIKEDILKFYPKTDSSKISVVFNAVEVSHSGFSRVSEIGEKEYLLCGNNHAIHKNYPTLLKAFSLIKDVIPHNLVIFGGKTRKVTPFIYEYIMNNNLNERVFVLDSLTDAEISYLYKNASILISPSLSEGFGRVPVEAGIQKVPVLISNESCHKEITMDLCHYYEPATCEKALSLEILKLLKNPPSDERLDNISIIFAEKYSSAPLARRLYNILTSIVN